MDFILASFRILIGLLFGCGVGLAASPAIAALTGDADSLTPLVAMSCFALTGVLLGMYAPTARRAFGRGFLLLGGAIFMLPVSALMLSGRVASEVIGSAEQGTEATAAIGAGAAGFIVTGLASFIGFFLGALLLLIGLILGGRREVIIVEHRSRKEPRITKR